MYNHREAIECALSGDAPDIVPFTFYDGLFPKGFDPAPLQAKGLAICARRGVFNKTYPNVKIRDVKENGGIRYIYETPLGSVTSFSKAAALGYAPVEHPIKKRDDYRVVKFIVEDGQYEPVYDFYLKEVEKIGQAGKVISHSCYEPLMDIQVSWVGQEQFCYELADNLDAVMDLHEALVRNHRKMYEVIANSPADYVLYGGNVVPEMLGPDRVRDMIAPCWNAFADALHEKGKKIGCHLDANNKTILDTVRRSKLDFIEAFTPPPDCNVSVKEARDAWPEKRLWINFPSSVHLRPKAAIRAATEEILEQAGDRKGFLMGVTEDVPLEHIDRSCSVILETIRANPRKTGSK